MKYALIIPDGAADEPLAELDGRTALEAAEIPHIDRIARTGRQGMVQTIPQGYPPGSDVAQMSILGYDPDKYYSGRAPLEAAAQGITTEPSDWIFRCNLVTIADGVMRDYSAGHIDTVQATRLIHDIGAALASDKVSFHPGVSYRHIMVHRGGPFEMELTPPHDILDEPAAKYLPKGKGGKELCRLMEAAEKILAEHDVNKVRGDLSENPATNIWLWGQGHRPQLDGFRQRFGLKGSVITAVDVLRGLGRLMGLRNIEVEGATGYVDTNFAGKGRAAIEALTGGDDLVVVHVEAPDEAGHGALIKEKVESIEQIDKHIVGPLLEWLAGQRSWRIMVLPDHPTPIRLRTHVANAVPVALAGDDVRPVHGLSYSEANAAKGSFRIERGHELMEYFLHGKG
ncbi:MAG: cofactor-independent phosphoglycerate mutase [Alphaproteobacteria bacterium]